MIAGAIVIALISMRSRRCSLLRDEAIHLGPFIFTTTHRRVE